MKWYICLDLDLPNIYILKIEQAWCIPGLKRDQNLCHRWICRTPVTS